MNIEKWTAAMQEALQKAFQEVLSMSRQVVDIEDLLLALIEDTSGIFYRVLVKADVDIAGLINYLENKRQQKPVVEGVDESQLRISYDLNQFRRPVPAQEPSPLPVWLPQPPCPHLRGLRCPWRNGKALQPWHPFL